MKKLKLSHCYNRSVHPHTLITRNVSVLKRHTASVHPVPLAVVEVVMVRNRVGHYRKQFIWNTAAITGGKLLYDAALRKLDVLSAMNFTA
jgi:hypothetical protein